MSYYHANCLSLCCVFVDLGVHTRYGRLRASTHGMQKTLEEKFIFKSCLTPSNIMIGNKLTTRWRRYLFENWQKSKLHKRLLSWKYADSWSWLENRSSSPDLSIERILRLLFDFHLSLSWAWRRVLLKKNREDVRGRPLEVKEVHKGRGTCIFFSILANSPSQLFLMHYDFLQQNLPVKLNRHVCVHIWVALSKAAHILSKLEIRRKTGKAGSNQFWKCVRCFWKCDSYMRTSMAIKLNR